MGLNTKIVVTIIPKTGFYSKKNDGDDIKVSVYIHLAPRLPDSGYLKEYFEMLNWPVFAGMIENKLSPNVPPANAVDIFKYTIEAKDDPEGTVERIGQEDSASISSAVDEFDISYAMHLWRRMGFNAKTPVSGWVVNPAAYLYRNVFSPIELVNRLRGVVEKTIDEITKAGYAKSTRPLNPLADVESDEERRLTPLADVKSDEERRLIIDELNELKKSTEIADFFNSYLFRSSNSAFKQYFTHLYAELDKAKKEFEHVVADLSLQLGNEDEVTERNRISSAEFHKRLSIAGENPELLKRTGWIFEREIVIPVSVIRSAGLKQSSDKNVANTTAAALFNTAPAGQIDFYAFALNDKILRATGANEQETLFFDEVEFLYSCTAFQLIDHGNNNYFFSYRYNPLSKKYLQIENGFVKPVPDAGSNLLNYSITASPEDTNQILGNISEMFKQVAGAINWATEPTAIGPGAPGQPEKVSILLDSLNKYTTAADTVKLRGMADNIKEYEKNVNLRPIPAKEDESRFKATIAKTLEIIEDRITDIRESLSTLTDIVSNGIAVSINNSQQVIENQSSNQPDKVKQGSKGNDQLIVFGHTLDSGYRVDVKYSTCKNGSKWSDVFSLNRVQALFDFSDQGADKEYDQIFKLPKVKNDDDIRKNLKNDYFKIDEMEPWVAETAQTSNSGKVYVHEDLFRWNGWSLVAPDVGEHVDDHGDAVKHDDTEGDKIYSIVKKPIHGSLPPLRFGWQYKFRLRVADFCGGGITYKNFVDGTLMNQYRNAGKNMWTAETSYKRMEPVSPPLIFKGVKNLVGMPGYLANQGFMNTRKGEGAETWVIRSYFDDWNKKLVCKEKARWYLAPPTVNLNFAALHGVLDQFLANPGNLLENRKLFAAADNEVMNNKDMELNGEKDYDVDYLADPVVCGVAVDGHVRDFASSKEYKTSHRYWENMKYMLYKIIADDKSGSSAADEIKLLQGQVLEKDIYCSVAGLACSLDQIFGLKTDTDNPLPKLLAPKIKKQKIKIVHAVQKPCLVNNTYKNGKNFNEIIDFSIVGEPARTKELNSVNFTISYPKFPTNTFSKIFPRIKYFDIQTDRAKPGGYEIVPVVKDIVVEKNPNTNGCTACPENDITFNLAHEFNDTRHRMVYVETDIESKFVSFYEEEKVKQYYGPDAFRIKGALADSSGVMKDAFPTDDEIEQDVKKLGKEKFLNEAGKGWLNIPSTARPTHLSIDYIVPLIKWSEINQQQQNDSTEIIRTCKSVRIYFNGNWFSSGEGEKVAVFIQNDESRTDGSTTNPLYLTNVISQVGKDPAADKTDFKDVYQLQITNGRKAGKNTVQIKDLTFERTGIKDENTLLDTDKTIEFKAITPGFDERPDYKQFYVDVELEIMQQLKPGDPLISVTDTLYFPFIRLAIARYQEHSLNDELSFSDVVMTDYFQLLPYRKVQVTPNTVKLSGALNAKERKRYFYENNDPARLTELPKGYNKVRLIELNSEQLVHSFDPEKTTEPNLYKIGDVINRPQNGGGFILVEYEDYQPYTPNDPATQEVDSDLRAIFNYVHIAHDDYNHIVQPGKTK